MNINIRFARPALALLLAGALAGCGGSADLDAASQATLHGEVQQLRAAAERDDRAAAVRELAEFRSAVGALLDGGEIDPQDAADLLAQAREVEASLPAPAATVRATAAKSRVATVQARSVPARPQPKAVTRVKRASTAEPKRERRHDEERLRWWLAVQRAWADYEGGDDD